MNDNHEDWTQEQLASMRDAKAEWERGASLKITLLRKIDTLKPGWWEWECEITDSTGRMRTGTIQSDGHSKDISTLEYDK